MARLAEQLYFVHVAAHDGLEQVGGRVGQRRQLLIDGDRVAGVRRHVGRRHVDQRLQVAAAAGEFEHLERRRDVRPCRILDRQVELHGSGTVDDMRDVVFDRGALFRIDTRTGLAQLTADDLDAIAPVGFEVVKAGRTRDIGVESIFHTARAVGANQRVYLANAELVASTYEFMQYNLAEEAGGSRQQDFIASRRFFDCDILVHGKPPLGQP